MPSPTSILRCAAAWVLGAASAFAGDDRLSAFDAPSKVKPGQVGLLKSKDMGMGYFLRVPKKLDTKSGARLIVFLHGSNMNGLDYLRSFESMNWADDALLCCPNGEQGSDPFGRNNFTFGSAPFVADVTREVQKAFKTKVTYVGGHSQGGFLTYSVITHFPELYRGALPMAGDCWMQNEPNLWEGQPDVLEKQRRVALAVIHGKADPVVDFSQGQHGYDCFRAMGWSKLRLFAPAELGHQFMLSPVQEALDWLDAMNGIDEKRALELASRWAKDGEWGWVLQALESAQASQPKLQKDAEAAAKQATAEISEALEGPAREWLPKWLEFWRVYGASAPAKSVVKKYLERRDKQRGDGARLFEEARALFQQEKKDEAYAKLEKLLQEAPCTYEAYYAVSWLAARK